MCNLLMCHCHIIVSSDLWGDRNPELTPHCQQLAPVVRSPRSSSLLWRRGWAKSVGGTGRKNPSTLDRWREVLVVFQRNKRSFLAPTRKAMKLSSSTIGTPSNSDPMRTVFCEELKHPTSERLGEEEPFAPRKGHQMDDITHVAPAATL